MNPPLSGLTRLRCANPTYAPQNRTDSVAIHSVIWNNYRLYADAVGYNFRAVLYRLAKSHRVNDRSVIVEGGLKQSGAPGSARDVTLLHRERDFSYHIGSHAVGKLTGYDYISIDQVQCLVISKSLGVGSLFQ